MTKNEVVAEIIRLMDEEPENWKFEERTLRYASSIRFCPIEVWIANHWLYHKEIWNPCALGMNVFQKYRLYKAVERLRVKTIELRLKQDVEQAFRKPKA